MPAWLKWKRNPAPPGFGIGKVVPDDDASIPSRLLFHWLSPFLSVGFSRPLEKDDLYSLPNHRLTHSLTDAVSANFYSRVPPKNLQPSSQTNAASVSVDPDVDLPLHHDTEKDMEGQVTEEKGTVSEYANTEQKSKSKAEKSKYPSRPLLSALHATFRWSWWFAGAMKLCADTLQTTAPLVTKLLLTWLTESFLFHSGFDQTKPRGIGYGIGLSFALFSMQEISSLLTNHYTMISMTVGLNVRTAVIGMIFRKSLRLSGRARLKHSVGQVTTMISTDATRLEDSCANAHYLWVGPIQIVIGIALLINNLGYSALVGLGVLILGFPIQFLLVRIMFSARMAGVGFTDQRIRLTTEVLQGIRLVKLYAWEAFYVNQISGLREKEVATIRRSAIARSVLISAVTIIPIVATVLSFITYALSGHSLNPAIIFTSLQFFNIIRAPLVFFPIVLSSVSDALVALGRIGSFLTAEELEDPFEVDNGTDNKWAVNVDGSFTWESVEDHEAGNSQSGDAAKADKTGQKEEVGESENSESILPTVTPSSSSKPLESEMDANGKEKVQGPFTLDGLSLRIPKGAFVAIVGRVGSGKSSLLQALIGEMRRTSGKVVFGGTVAYVPQQSWIVNATLKENILFGKEEVEERFNEIVLACSLQHDIDMLPNGEQTEIGEKGINLSGGQKARVSLARAAYSDSDIVLLDDPLSAVDSHVGNAILENCLLEGPLANKTRILVTHALHVLARTDYIYVMDNGIISEEGTFKNLIDDGKAFSQLIEEYGVTEKEGTEEEVDDTAGKGEKGKEAASPKAFIKQAEVGGEKAQLMQEEDRERGSVQSTVYARYLKFAGGVFWAPVIIFLLALTQAASVGNNLFLGFWTGGTIHNFTQGEYIAVYAALGIAQAFFSFVDSSTFSLIGLFACLKMFRAALTGVLRSPVSFFDTTPMGRVMSRLSKDQDTLDTQLPSTLYALLTIFSNVIGTVALVFYTFPYLGIIFAPLSILYYFVAIFYRKSSVETKRLDSIMRSALYASYSETLTGLATVRAYRQQKRFIESAERGLDMENRAYYMTISIQRWLSVRLDFLGNILILGIGLFAAGFRYTVDPSKVGVVLSYSLSITLLFSEMVNQYAQNEQDMNAVERVLVYVDLPREGDAITLNDPPPPWPDRGEVNFEDVNFAYREGLPLVLKGVSFKVNSGEKVGIVGRTGAGKSSLLQALFRMVELQGGKIEVDGINIRDIGLETLRRQLALVPQDSTLFLGTLRENLDPQKTRTDAEIISALQRTYLLPNDGSEADAATTAKFSLDASVGDEGANYSAGEKQLLALCRALLKGSQIIVLDEATSSVDVETDSKLQKTIQSEFSSCTLLCIAHRLNTIAYYDRILVMDGGRVVEFDTPFNLFDKETSIFRSLCDEAGLTRLDIVRIRSSR